MYKKIFCVLGLTMLMSCFAYAQNATLKGKVTNQDGEPVEYATVRLMQQDALILGAYTDENGNYTLKPIPSGKFDLVVSNTGCQTYKVEGIEFRGAIAKFQDVELDCGGTTLKTFTVSADKPIFEKDQSTSQQSISSEDMENMSGKSVSSALNTMSGLTKNSSGDVSVRGKRGGIV